MAQGQIRVREGVRGRTYSIVVELGRDPATGKRRQGWKSYKTRALAQKALREKLTAVERGDDAFPESLTVRDYVTEQWIPHLRRRGKLRPRTIDNYEQLTRDHVFPVIGGMQLRAVRVAHVQRVLDEATARGLKPGTVGHLRGATSAAFTQACRWELLPTNPVRYAEPPKKEAVELRVPSPTELRAIIEAAKGTRFEIPILLSATTGARRNEVLGLRWANVDLDRGHIEIAETLAHVDGQFAYVAPKTARSKRVIPLKREEVERLRLHRTEQKRRLLAVGVIRGDSTPVCDDGTGQPLSPGSYGHRAQEIAAQAGVADCHLHAFRHGVISALANSGDLAIASEIAGHSSVSFTHSVYVHTDDSRIARQREALERALGAG